MASLEEVRKFFEGDKYATDVTGIVIEKADKGHSVVSLEPDFAQKHNSELYKLLFDKKKKK